MKVHVVTGGSGFLGQRIVNKILHSGDRVIIVDPLAPSDIPPGVEYLKGSILDADLLKSAFRRAHIVHHAAGIVPLARSPKEFERVNTLGTKIVFQAAKDCGIEHFNLVSSSAIYGKIKKHNLPVVEKTTAKPFESYGRSKFAAEQIVFSEMFSLAGMSCAILRPRTIIGPGRIGILEVLFNWIHFNQAVFLIGGGKNRIQLVHPDDVAVACTQAAALKATGVYNLGSDDYPPLNESIVKLIDSVKSKSKIFPIPARLSQIILFALDKFGFSPFGSWHYRTSHLDSYLDTGKAKNELHWAPQFSNDEMLKQSYDWYAANRNTLHKRSGSVHQSPLKRGILRLFMK